MSLVGSYPRDARGFTSPERDAFLREAGYTQLEHPATLSRQPIMWAAPDGTVTVDPMRHLETALGHPVKAPA